MADTLSEDQINELKEAFKLIRDNKTGTVDIKQLQKIVRAMGYHVTKEEIGEIITNYLDIDKKLSLDFVEFISFLHGAAYTLKNANKASEHQLKDMNNIIQRQFEIFVHDNKGYITLKDLKYACKVTGEVWAEETLKSMMLEFGEKQR